MKKQTLLIAFPIIVLISSGTATATYNIVEFPVYVGSGDQAAPEINGTDVVWIDTRAGEDYHSVYGKNLSGGSDFNVATSQTHITWNIAIDGDTVVWCDSRNTGPLNSNDFEFYGYDISAQTEFAVWTEGSQRPGIDIDGDIVVGVERSYGGLTSYDIYGYNLSTQTRFPICEAANYQYEPQIDGDVVVWWDRRTGNWEVYGYDFSTEEEFYISPGEYCAVSNDIVVFETSHNIYGYDISTENIFTITESAGYQYAPVISENFVVWADERNGDFDIYGYDLLTQTEFPVATGIGDQMRPAIDGNTVVWEDDRNGNWDIYGATIPEPTSLSFLILSTLAFLLKRRT